MPLNPWLTYRTILVLWDPDHEFQAFFFNFQYYLCDSNQNFFTLVSNPVVKTPHNQDSYKQLTQSAMPN